MRGQGGFNGNSAPAAGPIETMFSGLPGQGFNGNSAPAAGPIETMFQGSLGREFTVVVHRCGRLVAL